MKMFSNLQGLCFFLDYQYSHEERLSIPIIATMISLICLNSQFVLDRMQEREREKEGRKDSLGSIVSLPST